jgi:DNA recombination protein RmuC
VDPLVLASISLLLGAALGAAVLWLARRKDMAILAGAVEQERVRADTASADQDAADQRAEGFREQLEADRVAKAGAEARAARVPQLEEDLSRSNATVRELTGERSQLSGQAGRIPRLEAEVARLTAVVTSLTAEKTGLETRIRDQEQAHSEKLAILTSLRGEIEKDFKSLANDALTGNQKSFLELADQVFQKHRDVSTGDLEKRQEAIANLLKPVADTLEEYRKGLSEVEKARLDAYAGLARELQNVVRTQTEVRTETSKLVNALRAAPKTRGRWGEQQLQNVLELSGMMAYVDFVPEETFVRDDTRLRPDAIIRLPGDRFIVVDAKTSMTAYLDAVDCVDDSEREAHLVRHAQQLRQHMRQLSAKAYWDGLIVTPDFVAMFVAGDNFFSAAMERDPHLFEDAVAARILIVTPTTLIALAKAVAFGWRQEKLADNARRIAELGRDLYKRLQVMGGHLVQVGSSIDRTVRNYNAFVGSLEGSVMPQARKFTDLEIEGTQDAIEVIDPVERDVRVIRTDRDLVIRDSQMLEGALNATADCAVAGANA